MRKYYLSLFVSLVVAIVAGGCKSDTPEVEPQPQPQPQPNNPVKPEVMLTPIETTETTFSFEIESSLPGTYGFFYSKDVEQVDVPDMPTWFDYNQGKVEDKVTVTIEDLDDGWDYTLLLVVRDDANSLLSSVQKLQFKTPARDNYIVVDEVGYDFISFTVNMEGTYLFDVVASAFFTDPTDPESKPTEIGWLASFGIEEQGVKSYKWIDGGSYDGREMSIKAGFEYWILAAECDAEGTITGEVRVKKVSTLSKPQSDESVAVELSEISSTFVKIITTPSESISSYYIYVLPEYNYNNIITNYGASQLISLIKSSQGSIYYSTREVKESEWGGLVPASNYYVAVAYVDTDGAENYVAVPFTTSEASAEPPTLDVSIYPTPNKEHESMTIVIKAKHANAIKYAFNTTADVDLERDKGYVDSEIVGRGADLTAEQLAAAATEQGCVIEREFLWYHTEYTAIVRATNAEYAECVETVAAYTESLPQIQRVESDLFESLVGTWEVSYSYYDTKDRDCTISNARVVIQQGVDEYSEEMYRSQNRLVILDWPFQSDYQENPIETPYPADYMSASSYWNDNPELAYRDYGPKLFLQIGEGDVVTMPTALNQYFYNESPVGGNCLYFMGTDTTTKDNADVSFPVEVSEDGNTITIKPYYNTSDKYMGTVYYPAIWLNQQYLWNLANSDIVLRRVE